MGPGPGPHYKQIWLSKCSFVFRRNSHFYNPNNWGIYLWIKASAAWTASRYIEVTGALPSG